MAQPIYIAHLDTYVYIDSIPSRSPSNKKLPSQRPHSLLLIPTDLHIKATSHLRRGWLQE